MILITILSIFAGCFIREFSLEAATKEDPGCGNLITFSSFLFITIHGFVITSKYGTLPPKVPISSWTTLVVMYFVVSVTNNYALNFNISMPLHMIFRSGSLLANMILGMFILRKRYTKTKYFAVLMISVGICLCTLMSASEVSKKAEEDSEEASDGKGSEKELFRWMIGISMLTFALFLSARMGVYQEEIYAKYGKHPMEALFYSHCLPLPGFLLLYGDIQTHFQMALHSTSMPILGLFNMPSTIFHLICNVLAQYICISSVFRLTSECTSLTVNLVVTLRKFSSLLFSIWYFNNPFTAWHWMGTFLVFSGTIMFSDVFPSLKKSFTSTKLKEN